LPASKKLKPYVPKFSIAVDSNEGQPWTFTGIKCDWKNAQTIDGERHIREIQVEMVWKSLGRYPYSQGDYSVVGLEDEVAIERKSIQDAWSTFVSYDTSEGIGRTSMFERELENLSAMDAAIVIIEGSLQACMAETPEYSSKPPNVLTKLFHRRSLALIQDYGVPFLFCDTRRLAEISAYRFLERYHRKWSERENAIEGTNDNAGPRS